ncbi:MAG: V-type ATP synthase subunit E family protein [Thermoplasmata archaeon]
MGLEQVVEDILAEGERRATSILAEARAEREKILSEARERARELREKRLAEAEKEAAQLRVRELASAELEAKRNRLRMEREMLEAAAEAARRRISALQGAEEEAILERLLKKVPPGYRVLSCPRNEEFLRRRLGSAYAGTVNCLGGLILESPDASVRIDLTYDTIFKEVVESTMKEVHTLLFPK